MPNPLPLSATAPTGSLVARRLARRLVDAWLVKAIGTAGGTMLFLLAYFWILRGAEQAYVMPVTIVDTWIPVQPSTLVLYVSLWPYISVAAAVGAGRRELSAFALACALVGGVGLALFIVLPTQVPPMVHDWSASPMLAMLKQADVAANACPSMHVAFAVLGGIWLDAVLLHVGAGAAVRILNAAWAVGIVYSTLALRQHVFLDVVAGAALGLAAVRLPIAALRAGSPVPRTT